MMREVTARMESVTRAIELIERYNPGPGCPTVTLLFSSLNLRPLLSFHFMEHDGEDQHSIYYEDDPYCAVNGYDNVTRGTFTEGLDFLEGLVNAQS